MSKKTSVLVVDDHPLFREGIISLLSRQKNYEVVGQAETGKGGIAKACDLRPQLVLMDVSLPDMSGIDAVYSICAHLPETKTVVLSMHAKIDFITDAFKAGARGYLNKEISGEKLLECLQTVERGEYYMDGHVSNVIIKNLMTGRTDRDKYQDPAYGTLTQREQEIMRLIAEGLSTREIAEKLFISQKTVENHRSSIFGKLDIHSTMELVRYAAKYGLIDVDLWKG